MNFPYSVVVSQDQESGDYLLFRRPEVPVTMIGPARTRNLLGLVDTGSVHTIVPIRPLPIGCPSAPPLVGVK